VEEACREQQGNSLDQMASALITTFLDAKMKEAYLKGMFRPNNILYFRQ
jgi:hypothetical protein